MRIVAITKPNFAPLERLRQVEGIEIVEGHDPAALRGRISGADAILLAPRYGTLLSELWLEVQTVRWIHALGAGVETLPFDLLRRSEVIVTNSRGLYADALSEFVIAAILWFAKDLRRLVVNQEAKKWEPYTVQRVEGKTAGIIGYGGVGQAIGRRAAALGMNVIPVRRSQEFGDPTIEEVIAQSDFLIVSTPLTLSTHRLLSRERLEQMQPHAVLINVGRGPVVDEEALIDMLRSNRIRGAALDVFEVEPLPESSPLWQLENVLLSPHTADHVPDSHDRAMSFFLENLARFRRGESLENVVDKEQGY